MVWSCRPMVLNPGQSPNRICWFGHRSCHILPVNTCRSIYGSLDSGDSKRVTVVAQVEYFSSARKDIYCLLDHGIITTSTFLEEVSCIQLFRLFETLEDRFNQILKIASEKHETYPNAVVTAIVL
ncbi:uncharacterized protein EV154DRAFT_482178 [Mucor mucedo]|uniref:uncharacterized protein n=1 Tax=Mucor mucedo TaxID=29922 RepID=UPI00221FBCAC|nr:uncharacterized protein EV154DRAFT_482178 [Mucor mucedo]KAI7890453.1 hypothetical protein EV154DRAFT_482178 [Mucor mucedo]